MFELKITANTVEELLKKAAALGALGSKPSQLDVPLPEPRVTTGDDAPKPKRTKRILPVTEAEHEEAMHAAQEAPQEPEAEPDVQPEPEAEKPSHEAQKAEAIEAAELIGLTEPQSVVNEMGTKRAELAAEDDADAEGLAGASAAQDALDAEQTDDLPPEFKTFVEAVEAAATFVEVKTALATFFATPLFKGMPLDQQNHVRYQTWATLQDRADEGAFKDLPNPATDVSAFRLWIEAQNEPEAITQTLASLETHPNFSGKPDEFKAGIRKAAADRIADL